MWEGRGGEDGTNWLFWYIIDYCYGNIFLFLVIFRCFYYQHLALYFIFFLSSAGYFQWLIFTIYWRFLLPPSTDLILIFNLVTNRKIKKKQVADVTSEQVLDASLFGEHSIHSDYWHRCDLLLFYFSSVSKEVN